MNPITNKKEKWMFVICLVLMIGTSMPAYGQNAQNANGSVPDAEPVQETTSAPDAEPVQETTSAPEAEPVQETTSAPDTETIQEELLATLPTADAQESLDELLGEHNFSFIKAVKSLMRGEIPLTIPGITAMIKNALFQELNTYRKMAAYLLGIILASAVFSNFAAIFDKRNISDISYYMMYLLMVTLLMKVFSSMTELAAAALGNSLKFMQALLPVCIAAVYLVTGSLTAMGFYQLTLLAITGVQWVMNSLLIPMVQVYVILLIINQMMKEDYLSKMAELVKTAVLWVLKTVIAVLFGMQVIQGMVSPAADQMKSTALSKIISLIPGIGNAYEVMTETVFGAALLLKNAVGAAGVCAIALICLVPVVKLGCGVLLYRLLGAVAQPVADKRVSECIDSVAAGGELLLRIVIYAGILFVVTLAVLILMAGKS